MVGWLVGSWWEEAVERTCGSAMKAEGEVGVRLM